MKQHPMTRRLAGYFRKRLDEARLDLVKDPRDPRGQRWQFKPLLRTVLVGLAAGCHGLAEVEDLTTRMGSGFRQLLGLSRRVPDTTLRDLLTQFEPVSLNPLLHRVTRAAHRRRALSPEGLPFGVLTLDGKYFSLPSVDDGYCQQHGDAATGNVQGQLRSTTAVLTSTRARPCIDVTPVLASTNEMGTFERALQNACDAYGSLDLFRLVTYDAGACSLQNASFVRQRQLHYLFGLKSSQPTLYEEAKQWLGACSTTDCDATSEDIDGNKRIVRRLYVGSAVSAPEGWETHLRTVLRVQTLCHDRESGELVGDEENRYFVSSLACDRLAPDQWLLLIRRHWGVETCHQILDTALAEDSRPWITHNPRASLVVAILRRVVYTLLSLFRSVTQRSETRRQIAWKRLMADVLYACHTVTSDTLRSLRRHCLPPDSVKGVTC
jgi:hypothetical protein